MIAFFGSKSEKIYAVVSPTPLNVNNLDKLIWLFNGAPLIADPIIEGPFRGPRAAMITPWSSNAVDISRNMGIDCITRVEEFFPIRPEEKVDPMLCQKYEALDQDIFSVDIHSAPIFPIQDIPSYNAEQGLALSEEEIAYLQSASQELGRPLTDSEVFGFSQVNSEHCRHKIFNGKFILDGIAQEKSLFQWIKWTSRENPGEIVSAYKDNVAFIRGPEVIQFAPESPHIPSIYSKKAFRSVLSLKAETHNFPTTVEPFNGAATGSGGEIRDRMAGGKGSFPLAGTAVYMTAYPRLTGDRRWLQHFEERPWLYQNPIDILIKASNGASDFGNKFGQPLICGSILTFEHEELGRRLGYDKVIMLAGGVGYGKADQAQKDKPQPGDSIVLLGGDNYRIGMGGAAVSSTDTGVYGSGIELNAVQRSNPEMQKRVANVIRGMMEEDHNPILSIHDHGAGGHLNCLSELVEESGGVIEMDELPIGDPTLSAREIIGNESQERMGLVIDPQRFDHLKKIAERERAPIYEIGKITGDGRFSFVSRSKNEKPLDLPLKHLFGSSPETVITDHEVIFRYADLGGYKQEEIPEYVDQVLRLESVACKDWLTNKVDRCVGGRVAKQQCAGPLQLPLNNVGVMAIDFDSHFGIATSVGHAPISALINVAAGSRNAAAEALSNLLWAPLAKGIESVSLSANWMWPCKNAGEDARLYAAVKSLAEFCKELGINIPTGKDSLSMKQKYPGYEVLSPGTVIISSVALCRDIRKIVEPVLKKEGGPILYINLSSDQFQLGGSAFAQIQGKIGDHCPDIKDPGFLKKVFNTLQDLIMQDQILAGHDISSGGMITTLLEMCFADSETGAEIDLSELEEHDLVKILFSENSGVIFQIAGEETKTYLDKAGIKYYEIGHPVQEPVLKIRHRGFTQSFDIFSKRQIWYETSFLLDQKQTAGDLAKERFNNYHRQPLEFDFPKIFTGKLPVHHQRKIKAAIIREQGSNSERELAHALHLAGFEVRDVHMTDLISGRETLDDIRFLGAVGGFSNSDVLGSAKGWAGSFLYNQKAKDSLERFFRKQDVLSIGICNGCQLFMELNLINPGDSIRAKMNLNDSGKHESAFTSVRIRPNHSVMLSALAGTQLGVWISHGEGKFILPLPERNYHIVAQYGYETYPSNPNGSDYNTAMLCSMDGRHLVTMPHIERSIFPWNWAHYADGRNDEVSPWLEAFIQARIWLEKNS